MLGVPTHRESQMSMKAKVIAAASLSFVLIGIPALAQNAPLPGAPGGQLPQVYGQPTAPVPGANPRRIVAPTAGMGYADLPLSCDDAKARIVELTNLMPTTRPQDLQDRVEQLCNWLGDMVDAHNKMANSFAKHEPLKAQSNAERQTAQRFARLKNQAQLLKADLLISMRRFPEALTPLVDISTAEPTTETGKGAYKRLQDLGFSPETPEPVEAEASSVTAPPAKQTMVLIPPRAAKPTAVKKTASLVAPHRH